MTERLHVDARSPDRTAIARAADCLRRGGLVAFPTETVYGLGAHALDRGAVLRLFAAKERPSNDPLIVHLASIDHLPPLVDAVPAEARALASRFWPGPLTLVMRRSRTVPDEVTAGLDTIAVRVPSHTVAHALIDAAQIPVAAPSANLFSRPSPTTADHVLADLDGRIDIIIDAGPTPVGVESTVLDLSATPPVVLRPGAVGIEALRALLPTVRRRDPGADQGSPLPSPGLMSRHYSPVAPLTVYDGHRASALKALAGDVQKLLDTRQTVAVLAFSDDVSEFRRMPVQVIELGPESESAEVAARLYAALRECDESGADAIVARMPGGTDALIAAIRDRLRRAAGGRVVATEA